MPLFEASYQLQSAGHMFEMAQGQQNQALSWPEKLDSLFYYQNDLPPIQYRVRHRVSVSFVACCAGYRFTTNQEKNGFPWVNIQPRVSR